MSARSVRAAARECVDWARRRQCHPPREDRDAKLDLLPRRSSRAPLSRARFAVCWHSTLTGRRGRTIGRCVPSSGALAGGGTCRECVLRFLDRPPASAINEDWLDGRAGLGVDKQHARAFRRKVLVAPGEQRNEDGTEIAPARGQQIFVARRPFAVTAARQNARVDQGIEPSRQGIRRDPETLLELIEPRQPVERITQNENAPPLAHALETAGDRAYHPAKTFSLH